MYSLQNKLLFAFPRILFLVLFIPTVLWAQKNTNKALAAEWRKVFKDDKLVLAKYASAYSFEIRNNNLQAIHADHLEYISLEGGVAHRQAIFYNDHLSILSSEVSYTSGKSMLVEKVCGNYEVEDVFYSDAKVCAYALPFAFEGTEITFESKTVYDDPKYLTKLFFHDPVAVGERTITFSIPASVNVELVEKNFAGFDIKKTMTEESGRKTYTYLLKNLKAQKREPNSLGALYYAPHLVVVTKDYLTNGGRKTVISSVDDLYKWYHGLTKEVKNDPSMFKAEVARLTATAKTPEEKIRNIYYWVQDNIHYIAFEDGLAGFRPDAAQNVYHNRYGDCKGMANLTKEMLKEAGFDARLTWIGTNRIPYTYALPSLAVDNHMICTVYSNDKHYILDPTEKYIALGKHAERIQGKEILIENGDKYVLKTVPLSTADQNQVMQQETISLEGEVLKGEGNMVVNGESRKNILYFSTNIKQEDQKKLYEKLVVPDYSNEDKVSIINAPSADRDKAMEVDYTYALNNKVTRFDKELYVDVDWSKSFKNLKIEDDRESDYYFNRKMNNKVIKKLKVPGGYTVTHLPKELSKKHSDFSFEITFKQEGDVVVYTNEIIITHGLVKKADFPVWNNFIRELNETYNDQIVLTQSK